MASSWTHAIAAVAIAAPLVPRTVPRGMWLALAIAAAVPDIDAIGRPFGGGDVAWLGGHRALTHSLAFATVLGFVLAWSTMRSVPVRDALRLWLAISLAVASHGALDALTTYGDGIEFLAPLSSTRYWAPWRPLGDGPLRDSIAFVLFYCVARITLKRRSLPLPRALNPRFLRAAV